MLENIKLESSIVSLYYYLPFSIIINCFFLIPQFSPALQQSLHVVVVALAAYGDGFKRHNGNTARALSSFLHSGKYVVDPELRAKRIVELTQHVSVPFCKSFWSLTENHGIQVIIYCGMFSLSFQFLMCFRDAVKLFK